LKLDSTVSPLLLCKKITSSLRNHGASMTERKTHVALGKNPENTTALFSTASHFCTPAV